MSYNIDLQDIANKLDFDLEDVQMLVEVFLETTQEPLDALKLAIESKNFEDIYRSAHAIKGSAANLTMTEIANIAKEIELSARENQDIDYFVQYQLLKTLFEDIKH